MPVSDFHVRHSGHEELIRLLEVDCYPDGFRGEEVDLVAPNIGPGVRAVQGCEGVCFYVREVWWSKGFVGGRWVGWEEEEGFNVLRLILLGHLNSIEENDRFDSSK